MEILGLGIDLAEIERVRRLLNKHGEHFKRRCFTNHEWEYANRYADPAGRLAARFAAKEAVMKSLGLGWRRLRWRDIEVTGGGAPRVNLKGGAAMRADQLGVAKIMVSITHTDESALVVAMATSR